MWKNTYKDYKPDKEFIHEKVAPGQGIIGCEMHEINGWGESLHVEPTKKRGFLHFIGSFFQIKKKS